MKYHGHQFRVYNPNIGDGRGFTIAQFYKNKKLDHLLYHEDVGKAASIVSKIPKVRKSMLDIQHACARDNNLIANGKTKGILLYMTEPRNPIANDITKRILL